MIYLLTFGISAILLKVNIKEKHAKMIMVIIALLLPCILAGLRADSVGTDTAGYPHDVYEIARNTDFFSFFKTEFVHSYVWKPVSEMGIGYATFVFIVANIFQSFSAVLFFTAVVIVFCVYRAANILFDKKHIWLVVLLFYLLFYGVTLNMMRQWMAMALLLVGFAYLVKGKKRCIIYAAIGVTFHTTAVCGVLIYLLFFVIKKWKTPAIKAEHLKSVSSKLLPAAVIMLCCLFVVLQTGIVSRMLAMVGLGEFSHYLSGTVVFSMGRFLIELPLLFLVIVNWKYIDSDVVKYTCLTFAVVNLLLSQLNTMNVLAWRVSAYFSVYSILAFPYLIFHCTKKIYRQVEIPLVCCYGLMYWCYYILLQNMHKTLPYLFR